MISYGGEIVNVEKTAGLTTIILGLICIIFPMFSSEFVSIIVGLSLLFFGISTAFMGYNMRYDMDASSKVLLVIGIISVILGILFLFFINALSFLVSIQLYIVGFIMLVFGISGLITRMNTASLLTSILVLVMGIVSLALAVFSLNEPIYIAIIMGVGLVIEGVSFLIAD